jgi:hypothetical protein
MDEKFIVAEISKNWPESDNDTIAWNKGQDAVNHQGFRRLLAQRFEDVINRNHQRGYKLMDWKFTQHWSYDETNETIIAVFERDSVEVEV